MNDNSKFDMLLSLVEKKLACFIEYLSITKNVYTYVKNEKNAIELFNQRDNTIEKVNSLNSEIYNEVNLLSLTERGIFSKLIKNSASVADYNDTPVYAAIAKTSAAIASTISEIKQLDKIIDIDLARQRHETQLAIRNIKKEVEAKKHVSILKSFKA